MYSNYVKILVELEETLCTLTLNRPESRNALDQPALDEMLDFLGKAKDDPNIRCVVITGAGDKAFSAGADVKEWNERNKKRRELGVQILPGEEKTGGGWVPKGHAMIKALRNFPKPVIAAVNGVAVGAGFDIALAADIRFGSSNARFGQAYIKVATVPDCGGTYLLPRIIGWARATEMIFTGDTVNAEEAYGMGLITHLTTPENLMAEAKALAKRLSEGPTVAINQAKLNLNRSWLLDFEAELDQERAAGKICLATEDNGEGVRAAAEKRKPVFKGR